MENVTRLESISDFRMGYTVRHRDDTVFLISGELMNKVRDEMEKGDRAVWLLEEIVRSGSTPTDSA